MKFTSKNVTQRFSDSDSSLSDNDDPEEEESDTATSINFDARGSSSTAPEESENEDGATSEVPAVESSSYPVPGGTVVSPMTSMMGSRPGYANQVGIWFYLF